MESNVWYESGALASVVGAILGILPAVTALVGLLYWSAMLYEKVTGEPFHRAVRRWVRGR